MAPDQFPNETNDPKGMDLDKMDSTHRQCVLIVDDDPDTVFLLKQILRAEGYDVMSAMNGQEALNKIGRNEPNLILLDIMMPEMNGRDTFMHIRKMSEIPVIFLSAISSKDRIVGGLQDGADDYITKPFFNQEVVERVKAVLRRVGKRTELRRLVFPSVGLALDLTIQQVILNGHDIHLAPKEFAFLALIAKHAPATVSYEIISNAIFDDSPNVRKRTNYLVHLLRKKLKKLTPDLDLFINIDRLGYRLRTEKDDIVHVSSIRTNPGV